MERVWIVSYGLAWLLVLAQGLTLVAALWVIGRIHLKRAPEVHALITDEGPEIHTVMPEFEGRDTEGRLIRSGDYRGSELALLLLSPDCAPCEQLLRAVNVTRQGLAVCPELLAVMEAPWAEAHDYRRRYRLDFPFLVDEEAAIRASLGVERTPYGFLVDSEGIVRMKGVVSDRGQLEGLTRRRGRHVGSLAWQTTDSPEPQAVSETAGAPLD